MALDMALEAPEVSPVRKRDYGSSARLWGGFFARSWLWFLAGCLVVTFLPMLFGWRPYVVESGSMQPRIKVGDVIMSSPEHDAKKLLGHVTVFEDPDASRAGTVKSHRVISINKDGTMVTKGDANPTADPVPLPMSDVKGIGRLLVRWIGLPLIWVQHGQWLKLALLVGSLWLAAFLVVRDQDPPVVDAESDDEPGDDRDDESGDDPGDGSGPEDGESDADGSEPDDESDDGENGPDAPLLWKPRASGIRRFGRSRHRRPLGRAEFARVVGVRLGVVVVAATGLLVPTAQAAFSATTSTVASAWATAASFAANYTQAVEDLNPYLYWKLDDGAGTSGNRNTTATDSSTNNRNGKYSPTPYNSSAWDMQEAGALTGQTPNYSAYSAGGSGTNVSCVTTNAAAANPAPVTYSEIIWFKTPAPVTSKNGKTTTYYSGGGKLIGFESKQTGVSDNSQGGQYDRMIYMDSNGQLYFGVWTGAATTASTTTTYNDGNWHMAVATMGGAGGDGMKLYVDGVLVNSNANTTSQDYAATNGGWWRVGCGNLQGWGGDWGSQTNYAFTGNLDEATVYTTELSAQNVATLYADGTGTSAPPPTPPPNLINGDFETGSLSPWTCPNGTGAVQTGTTHANSGYALSMSAGFFQMAECDQTATLLPNHTYTLTAYVEGNTMTVGVSGGATASTTSSSNGWNQVTLSFTTGSNATVTVSVSGADRFGGTYYADDFVLS